MKITRQHSQARGLSWSVSLGLMALFAAIPSFSDAAVWNGGGGNWSDTTKWDAGIAPGVGDTAEIDGAAFSQTIIYNGSKSLGSLLLGQGAAGTTNALLLNLAGTIVAPSLAVANDVTLGGDAGLGAAQIQLGGASGVSPALSINGGNGKLTIDAVGVLLISGTSSVTAAFSPVINANVDLSGGTITLNSSSTADGRLIVMGNFNATGGTIERVAGSAGQGLLQLKGATNVIDNVTLSDAQATTKGSPYIYLNGSASSGVADQSLSTNVNIANLAFRAASGTKTLSGTGVIGALYIGNYTAGNVLTFKLGSDLASTSGFMNGGWGGAAGATIALETNGHNFAVTNILNFITGDAPSATWNIANSSTTASLISATSIVFNTASNYSISGPLTLEATTTTGFNFNTAAITVSGPVTLKTAGVFDLTAANAANLVLGSGVTLQSTGTGTSNLGGWSGINFRYTGASGRLASTGALASIEVGDGTTASTLTRSTTNLSGLTGNLKINSGSTYNSGGWSTTLTGAASITGSGTYKAVNSTGNVTWTAGSAGGLSAGGAAGEIGTLSFSAAGTVSGIPTLTLISTSVSTFDIASLSSFDVVNLGAFNATFNGTLSLNFIAGYAPHAGDTFNLFQSSSELNSNSVAFTGTKSGNFTSITSNLSGYEFSFDAATGVLTVIGSAIPEPSAVAFLAGAVALLGAVACKRRRRIG